MRDSKSLIGILLLILGYCMTAFTQTRTPAELQDWGNRYEGRIEVEIAAPPIEPVAFYGYGNDYSQKNYSPTDILKVKFYLHETPRQRSDISLTAREIELKEFYWMEAKPESFTCTRNWYAFARWPVRDVLGPFGIPADNLGVLVRLKNRQGINILSPVVLYYASSPPVQIEQYVAYFRPGEALVGGNCRIYRECTENSLIQSFVIGSQAAGIPFPIIFQLSNDWRGWVRIRIEVRPISGVRPWPTHEFCFFHISNLGGD